MPRLDPHPFRYIAPNEDATQRMKIINDHCSQAYDTLIELIPDCRERALAITKLQEFRMWANTAVVMEQKRADRS